MNRINWITYLKILYDQLEKIKEPLYPKKHKKTFLSDTILQQADAFSNGSDYDLMCPIVEKVSRDSFVLALSKIMNCIPLMSPEEYRYRFRNEQAISFN